MRFAGWCLAFTLVSPVSSWRLPLIISSDIAVNLTDSMFQGTYGGRKKHEADLKAVIERAKAKSVEKILITGTSLNESKAALEMAKEFGESLEHFDTV